MHTCERMISVCGKTSDLCHVTLPDGTEKDGYVPSDLNIGGGDYVEFSYCADCGKIQGEFPVK